LKETNQSSATPSIKQIQAGDPIKPRTEVVRHEIPDLPSFSQVDMTVFEALPRALREELENEYKRRSASPFPGADAGPVAAKSVPRAPSAAPSKLRRSTTPNVFPQRRDTKSNATNVKRITQQLAPRSRSSISPDKSALYAWALKPKSKKGIKVSEKVLRELNLDPEVFFELPIPVQSEQLAMARILRDKGSIPEPPKERKILKPRKHELPPDFVPYIAPKPKARHPTPPCLRQYVKGQKLAFTETDDVQRIVETWVMTYHKWAPRDKDVEFLSKYLVQSVDRSVATDVGVERAIKVMKWWLVLLRRLFPASEVIDEEDEGVT
jgi:DNA repair protein REV1